MRKYIALLRGINISGKNKISMNELKEAFFLSGFSDVLTHLNSGNVLFNSSINIIPKIEIIIKQMILEKFNLEIPVIVLEKEEIKDILVHKPLWWDTLDKNIYDNLIFMLKPLTFEEAYKEIGPAKELYEKIENYHNVIYWSFILKDYSKTNWFKTASSNINYLVTIRTANTIKKIIELCEKE